MEHKDPKTKYYPLHNGNIYKKPMMSIEKYVIEWCFFQNNTSKYDTPKPKSFTAIHLGSNTNHLAHMDWRHRHQTQLVRLCSPFDTLRVIAVILTLKRLGHFFFKMQFYFLMLSNKSVIFSYENAPINWLFNQYWGYWWPGALAPGHQ